MIRHILGLCLLAAAVSSTSWARGASPYLPLQLAPEIERQIERVLILADNPVLVRPIAAATVLDALPAACRIDPVLCRSVRRYLDRYMGKFGLPHASAEIAAVDGAVTALPNGHGMSSDSAWQASLQSYWQPGDYVILSLGGVADEGDAIPTGSVLSLGFEYAQLDVGYRDHWFSPFSDSAMIISTQGADAAFDHAVELQADHALRTPVRSVLGRDGALGPDRLRGRLHLGQSAGSPACV